MLSRYFRYAILAASVSAVAAQNSVPEDLRAGFSGDPELQVSFSNNAVEGFSDGTLFSQADVADEPTFALGDSSGVSPLTLYTILLLDTTSPTRRTLHYVRPNFKTVRSAGVNLASSSAPLLAYKPPVVETGSEANYTFLMYINPERENITELALPEEGEAFDVEGFQEENGLEGAVAGVGMRVSATGGGDEESSSAGARPSTSAAARTSTDAGGETVTPSSSTASARNSAIGASAVPTGEDRPAGSATQTLALTSGEVTDDGTPSATAEARTGKGVGSRVEKGQVVGGVCVFALAALWVW